MSGLEIAVARQRDRRGSAEGAGVAFALAALLFVPFILAAPLGRALDPHSFAAFSLALSLVLAISLLRTSAVRPAALWIRAGFISLGVLLLVDMLAVWLVAPEAEGSYAAAVALSRVPLLLEAPLILSVMAGVLPQGVRTAFLWSLPAIAFALVAELLPGRVVALLFGHGYPNAAELARPLVAGTTLGALTVVAVQSLLQRGQIWWISRVVPIALLLLPAVFLLRARPMALATAVLVAQAIAFLAIAIPATRAFGVKGAPRHVLFLAYRDLQHSLGGGSELYVHEVARHMVGEGCAVTVYSAAVPGAPRSEVLDGVRYRRGGSPFTVYPRAAFSYLTGRLGRPDIIVDVQNGVPFFAPLYSSKPVVGLVHHICGEQWQMAFPPRLARFGSWVESRVVPHAYSAVPYVVVSVSTRSDLVRLGLDPEHIIVIPNGTPRLPDPGPILKTSEPSICYLGRLVPHKRIELLIEAVARLRVRFPTVSLTLVGRGWWESRLRPVVERMGLEDAVRFVGWTDERTKARILTESWVLGMASAREGWGIAVAEAASMGIPAVAFRVGGLQESIVDGETGLLVDDLDGFVTALEVLLSDHELRRRFGAAARERALGFTWDEAGSRFHGVLDRATSSAEQEQVLVPT